MYTGRAILLIRSIIDQYPELYLDELRDWIYFRTGETYSIPTLSRCLRRIGLSVKKVSNKLLLSPLNWSINHVSYPYFPGEKMLCEDYCSTFVSCRINLNVRHYKIYFPFTVKMLRKPCVKTQI